MQPKRQYGLEPSYINLIFLKLLQRSFIPTALGALPYLITRYLIHEPSKSIYDIISYETILHNNRSNWNKFPVKKSTEMTADIFTKALPRESLVKFRDEDIAPIVLSALNNREGRGFLFRKFGPICLQ